MGPVQALSITGANPLQIVSQAIFPGLLPSLIGISLYRLDENVRSSLVLGFVGAGARAMITETVDTIAELFAGPALLSYLGEAVTLAQHMLQAAALAEAAGAAVAVRRWDEAAKDPAALTPSIEHFRPVLSRLLTAPLSEA